MKPLCHRRVWRCFFVRRFACVFFGLVIVPVVVRAQGTAFTYQGQLNDNGTPATGIYDLRFPTQMAATTISMDR
jgi:hypothetical protein